MRQFFHDPLQELRRLFGDSRINQLAIRSGGRALLNLKLGLS